jgi:cell division septation protein DedD
VETWYAIQVASLVRESNAVSLTKRLGDMGYTPDVRTVTTRITYHRVYVGELSSREEAERTARQLNVDGFPSNVVTLTGGKFTLQAGSFLRLNEAIDLAHTLQTKKYTAKIVSEPVPTPVHQVRVGKYASRAEARKVLESLKGKGFEPLVVKR